MNKFMLNITASSGEYYQGDCEDLVLPISDGVYGIQAGHSPVLVAIHMGILHFAVNGESQDILVGDGIAEVTPAYVMVLVDSAERPEDIDANRALRAREEAEEQLRQKRIGTAGHRVRDAHRHGAQLPDAVDLPGSLSVSAAAKPDAAAAGRL